MCKMVLVHIKKVFLFVVFILFVISVFAQFQCGNTFTDERDGQTYETVQIGTQCWMAKNLNYGIMIPAVDGSDFQTDNQVPEKYCYDNDSNNCILYKTETLVIKKTTSSQYH